MTRTLATCAAAALLLALSGCSSDPEPKFAEPTTSLPSTPASTKQPPDSLPSAPAMPVKASRRTEAGAKEFVRHFWRVANYAQSTGSDREFSALMSDQCTACEAVLDFLNESYSDGGEIVGGAYTVLNLNANLYSTNELIKSGALFADVSFTAENTRQVVKKPGSQKVVYAPDSIPVKFTLSYVRDHWLLSVWDA